MEKEKYGYNPFTMTSKITSRNKPNQGVKRPLQVKAENAEKEGNL